MYVKINQSMLKLIDIGLHYLLLSNPHCCPSPMPSVRKGDYPCTCVILHVRHEPDVTPAENPTWPLTQTNTCLPKRQRDLPVLSERSLFRASSKRQRVLYLVEKTPMISWKYWSIYRYNSIQIKADINITFTIYIS